MLKIKKVKTQMSFYGNIYLIYKFCSLYVYIYKTNFSYYFNFMNEQYCIFRTEFIKRLAYKIFV